MQRLPGCQVAGGRWPRGAVPAPHVAQASAGLPAECSLGPRARATGGGGPGRRRLRSRHTRAPGGWKRDALLFFFFWKPCPRRYTGLLLQEEEAGRLPDSRGARPRPPAVPQVTHLWSHTKSPLICALGSTPHVPTPRPERTRSESPEASCAQPGSAPSPSPAFPNPAA